MVELPVLVVGFGGRQGFGDADDGDSRVGGKARPPATRQNVFATDVSARAITPLTRQEVQRARRDSNPQPSGP